MAAGGHALRDDIDLLCSGLGDRHMGHERYKWALRTAFVHMVPSEPPIDVFTFDSMKNPYDTISAAALLYSLYTGPEDINAILAYLRAYPTHDAILKRPISRDIPIINAIIPLMEAKVKKVLDDLTSERHTGMSLNLKISIMWLLMAIKRCFDSSDIEAEPIEFSTVEDIKAHTETLRDQFNHKTDIANMPKIGINRFHNLSLEYIRIVNANQPKPRETFIVPEERVSEHLCHLSDMDQISKAAGNKIYTADIERFKYIKIYGNPKTVHKHATDKWTWTISGWNDVELGTRLGFAYSGYDYPCYPNAITVFTYPEREVHLQLEKALGNRKNVGRHVSTFKIKPLFLVLLTPYTNVKPVNVHETTQTITVARYIFKDGPEVGVPNVMLLPCVDARNNLETHTKNGKLELVLVPIDYKMPRIPRIPYIPVLNRYGTNIDILPGTFEMTDVRMGTLVSLIMEHLLKGYFIQEVDASPPAKRPRSGPADRAGAQMHEMFAGMRALRL